MADTPQYALGTNAQGQGMGSIIPTISSASLAPTTPVQLPPTPTPINTAAANASVPNPVAPVNPNPPIPGQTGMGTTTTPSVTTPTNTDAQNQQGDILNRIASLMGGNTSLATLQNQQETTAGVPALTKTVNDINTQLQGLDAQSQKLQLDAGAGGTIQNQNTNAAIGRMGTAGLAGANAESLRNNQIQQAGIAAQSLTLKSVLYGAQQSYSMAKTAADAAAQSVYDATTQQLNYEKAKLDAIAPQLSRDQAAQAATQKAALDQQAKQAEYQRTDNVAGNGLIQSAMQNFPNDAQAHYAIQQAAQIPLTDPQYLSKVQALVGQYQKDPVATQKAVLDNQLLRGQITEAQANAAKTQAETQALNNKGNGGGTTMVQDNNGNNVTVPISVAPYVSSSHSGIAYADLSTVQGTAGEKKAIVDAAQAAGIKVITNKNTALDLTNISDANAKLDSISTIMAGIDQPNALSRDLAGLGMTKFATMAQTNTQQAAAGALQGVGLDILKAISGVQGFRGNSSVVQQITDHLPSIYDTNAVVQQKTDYIRQLINDRENAIVGKPGTNSNATNTRSGTPFDVAGAKAVGYTDAQIQAYISAN